MITGTTYPHVPRIAKKVTFRESQNAPFTLDQKQHQRFCNTRGNLTTSYMFDSDFIKLILYRINFKIKWFIFGSSSKNDSDRK